MNYVTYDQFAFTAAVSARMVRERPATNFFIGHFFAESLILTETGQSTGAIQIAGMADPTQLPFFIATCDYTLIGVSCTPRAPTSRESRSSWVRCGARTSSRPS